MDSVLRISDLTVSFGEKTVLDHVSFNLARGGTLGIVGESGSGKSMTALSILGLLPSSATIDGGEIDFDGFPLLGLPEKNWSNIRGKRISLIFQEPFSALNPTMKCGLQIKEMLDTHYGWPKEKTVDHIYSLFERVGLSDVQRIYHSYPHELSGGQLQRVLISMAVACEPEIIIADEPTTALDVTVQKSVLELFASLQKELNCSVIFISHDLGVIREIADDVVVMQRGKVVERGTVKEVFERPKEVYTKGLLACRPPLDRLLERLPTVEDFVQNRAQAILAKAISPREVTERIRERAQHGPYIFTQNLEVNYPIKTNWWGKVTSVKQAVLPTNIEIYRGETLGLVGESGSGKSSLGKAILQLNRHAKGKVVVNGTDLSQLNQKELRNWRKEIQIIFQDPYSSLNPKMRVGDAISEVLMVHRRGDTNRKRRAMAEKLLETCGMKPEHYGRYPHEFSGGQRQRISIARTLAVDPSFIVCDESVSALDVSVQAQILNLLKDLQSERGLTYLFISHDLSVIRHMSDRVLVMKDGAIVESGKTIDVFESPQTAYTKRLIDAIPAVNV